MWWNRRGTGVPGENPRLLTEHLLTHYSTRLKTPQTCCKLSITPRCNKSVKIRLVTTCHLQTCYNLLKQFTASLWIISFNNQLADNLQQTCRQQAVPSHANASWYRLVVKSCCKMSTDLVQLARSWLCIRDGSRDGYHSTASSIHVNCH